MDSIELEVSTTVNLYMISAELSWQSNEDVIGFVKMLDEHKADAEFTQMLYDYARQALVNEGLEVDDTKSRLERAIAEIRAIADHDEKYGPPWDPKQPRAVIDGQGDRWELNHQTGEYTLENSDLERSRDHIKGAWGVQEDIY